jgi:hypothetical protein
MHLTIASVTDRGLLVVGALLGGLLAGGPHAQTAPGEASGTAHPAPQQPRGGTPSAPTNCAARFVNAAQGGPGAWVAWTDTSDNEDGFIVEYRLGNSHDTTTITVAADVTGALMPIHNGTNYYRVSAFNAAGQSQWSHRVSLRYAGGGQGRSAGQ